MKKYLSIALASLGIVACSSGHIAPEQYDATKHAKIRIFSYEQTYGLVHANIDCASNKNGTDIQVGSEMVNIFSKEKVKTIGMKQTENSQRAGKDPQDLAYQEFIVEAGKPVNIEPYVVGVKANGIGFSQVGFRNACDMKESGSNSKKILSVILPTLKKDEPEWVQDYQRSFVPEAGHSYEYLPAYQRCDQVSIVDISGEKPVSVPVNKKFICE